MTYNNETISFVQSRVEESCRLLLAKMSASRSVSKVECLIVESVGATCMLPRRVKFSIDIGPYHRIIIDTAVENVLNRPNALLARFHQELEKYDIKVTHDIQ